MVSPRWLAPAGIGSGVIHRMKNKLLTLEELEKSWWWNREDIRRDGVKGVDWPTVEEAARNYELMRRSLKF